MIPAIPSFYILLKQKQSQYHVYDVVSTITGLKLFMPW